MNMKGFTPLDTGYKKAERAYYSRPLTGFTLTETMIAISILAFAIAGPLFTADRAIVAAQTARDQLIASYLAQEGIEYVRAIRDNSYLAAYRSESGDISSAAWDNFLEAIEDCRATAEFPTQGCTLDPARGISPQSCLIGSTCNSLSLVNGLYRQQGNSENRATPYTRTVQAIDISPTEEKIVSKVSWTFHGTPYSVTVSDHLTSWQ